MKATTAFQACVFAAFALQTSSSPVASHVQQVIVDNDELEAAGLETFDQFLVELAPDKRIWISESEKWNLKRQGINFFDVTDTPELGSSMRAERVVEYPEHMAHKDNVTTLLADINTENMRKHLELFTAFHTRYYKSESGAKSSQWLYEHVRATLEQSGALERNASIRRFEHPWGQHSIIVSLPGRTNNTVVVSAHQDSVNLFFPALFQSPGADDDGSGTVTILEALRVLLSDETILNGEQENTLEFHWFSAEEGGLLGSQAVFSEYERQGRQVKAMLQQDMTGYVQGTLDAGEPESLGVITDFVDPGLTTFIKRVIDEYCDIGYVETRCGYACSDHASASKAGYPSAFVIESEFKLSNHKIHTTEDTIDRLSFEHMKQHCKLTVAWAYELCFAEF